jgi:hypothetical protein
VTDAPPPGEPSADPRDALIREQAERIEAQEQQIAGQAERLDAQEQRIAALEAVATDLRERLAAAERAGSRNSGELVDAAVVG